MKTVIYSLYQKKEKAKAKVFVSNIHSQLGNDVNLYILINDTTDRDFIEFCKSLSEYIEIFCLEKNLGVGSGRNYLINQAYHANADLFVSLDMDIIIPKSYIDDLKTSYIHLASSDPKLGLIQPILFDGRYTKEFLGLNDLDSWDELFSSRKKIEFNHNKFTSYLKKSDIKNIYTITFHTGVSNILRAHFACNNTSLKKHYENSQAYSIFSESTPEWRPSKEKMQSSFLQQENLRTQSVAGGVSVFGRSIIDDGFQYSKKFDPFLYEDSEFSFRLNLSGYNNYLISKTFAFHDPFIVENRTIHDFAAVGRIRGSDISQLRDNKTISNILLELSVFPTIVDHMIRLSNIEKQWQFLFEYYLNLTFGLFGNNDSIYNSQHPGDLFARIFAKLLKNSSKIELDNIQLPLTQNIVFIGSKGKLINNLDHSGSFSFCLKNCFLQFSVGKGDCASKFFDIYIVVKHCGKDQYQINTNIQANDLTYAFLVEVDTACWLSSKGKERIVLRFINGFRNQYDHGDFSVEELYPKPTVDEKYEPVARIANLVKYLSSNSGAGRLLVEFIEEIILCKKTSTNDSLLIIGNGPSTKKLLKHGFRNLPSNIDTFGMGAAYRYFQEIDWWPTYYAWCDVKVVHSHRDALASIIENTTIPTKRFFFSLPISKSKRLEQVDHSSTGDFCFRKAIELGYKQIYIIGVEGNYVEEIVGSRSLLDSEYYDLGFNKIFPYFDPISLDEKESLRVFREYLRIIEYTPQTNPNYFFDSYQQVGDVYSLPRTYTHRNAWKRTKKLITDRNVSVFNLSEISKLDEFPKMPWNDFLGNAKNATVIHPFTQFGRPIVTPKTISLDDRKTLYLEAGLEDTDTFACLIIGVKLQDDDHIRISNLEFLLAWIDRYYGDLFDVLLIEQGDVPRVKKIISDLKPYVRHEFIYNPKNYNRGWGYNVAVKHFTKASVVVLMDTDVLTGANFVHEVVSCHTKYSVISPYMNIYYSEPDESERIKNSFNFHKLRREDAIVKPVTITGGVVIIRKAVYEELAGFEQYIEYAGEDRSFDVTLSNHCKASEIRLAPYIYVHLHHPVGKEPRPNWKQLFSHLGENYGCKHDPSLNPDDNIHKNCSHVDKERTLRNIIQRRPFYGDLELYSSCNPLAINGVFMNGNTENSNTVIFPPAFKSFANYEKNEFYKAPSADSKRIATLYNAFKGKRCFILGNGPSLNKHDLSALKGEYVFAVNSIYYKTDETDFRPTFFVVEDSSVMKENIDRIRSYEAPFKFFPTIYKELHPEDNSTYFFRMNRGFYEKSSLNYCIPRFSADASKVLYCGQSVTYINLQLAYFMGFTKVYLIGMDFDYEIPSSHKRTGDILLSDTDDPNHFHKDYFGKGKTWKDPKLERVAMNYRMAKIAFESVGRKIYNATIGGKLEIFDRVTYESLFFKEEPASKERNPSGSDGRFRNANHLFRLKKFSDAASEYAKLAQSNPAFYLYSEAAINSYNNAKEASQVITPDLEDLIQTIIN